MGAIATVSARNPVRGAVGLLTTIVGIAGLSATHASAIGVSAGHTPKVTIPSPTMLHFRGGRAGISRAAYPELEPTFYEDVAKAYGDELRSLSAAGCNYVQMDDTNLAYLCDEKMREAARSRGDDPNELPHRYAGFINKVVALKPPGMTLAMHLCRGNFKSTHAAAGNYEPVAEALLAEMNLDAYFMEYDDDRSGDFRPLRFLPKGKVVVLGLVTTKFGEMENKDALKRRINMAIRTKASARHVVDSLKKRAAVRADATRPAPRATSLTEGHQEIVGYLDALHAEIPDVPLLVAEYGIGTDDDAPRVRERLRLAGHLDVRGFELRRKRVQRRANGPARKQHVVDQHNDLVGNIERDRGLAENRLLLPQREVVPIESNVQFADRHLRRVRQQQGAVRDRGPSSFARSRPPPHTA